MASTSTDSPANPPAEGAINRLLRSLTSPRSSTIIPPSESSSPAPTTPETLPESVKSPTPKSPTPLERFWKHARSKTTNEFPPSSWFETGTSTDITTVYKEDNPVPPITEEPEEEEEVGTIPNAEDQEDPSPQTLARRIQAMLSTNTPMATPPELPAEFDGEVPPPTPTQMMSPMSPIGDSRLLSFLSSPKMMNGSLSRGQQSVWSVLEKLHSPVPRHAELSPESAAPDMPDSPLASAPDTNDYDYDDDESSMMLCSPLIPQRDDLVELAETEYVPVDQHGRVVVQNFRSPLYQAHTFSDLGPHELMDPDEPEAEQGVEEVTNEPTEAEVPEQEEEVPQPTGFQWPWSKTPEKPVQKKKKIKEKRIWKPSATKISLQTTWWGYRIYLPPPVLDVLNNTQLEAAKRAAMITAALQWLLNNIPLAMIPPQFQLAMGLVKSLVPLVGYIGSFLAWSWTGVKQFDHGHGVTLTATWLLPIALVPGTWQAYEVPKEGTPCVSPTTELPPVSVPPANQEVTETPAASTPAPAPEPLTVSEKSPAELGPVAENPAPQQPRTVTPDTYYDSPTTLHVQPTTPNAYYDNPKTLHTRSVKPEAYYELPPVAHASAQSPNPKAYYDTPPGSRAQTMKPHAYYDTPSASHSRIVKPKQYYATPSSISAPIPNLYSDSPRTIHAQKFTREEPLHKSLYEERPTDTLSSQYSSPLQDSGYYQVHEQTKDERTTNMYAPEVYHSPPPVMVHTVPLPGDVPLPEEGPRPSRPRRSRSERQR